MSAFFDLINKYRAVAKSESEKGTYFEALCIRYFENEPFYVDEFVKVQFFKEWAHEQQITGIDTGIDLVATDKDGKFCAIQCKLYKEDSKVPKSEIDSFLSVSCWLRVKIT